MNAHPPEDPLSPHAARVDPSQGGVFAGITSHRMLGLSTRAVLEIVGLLLLAVLLTAAATGRSPLEAIRPEAGWAVVLLASAYYGVREGLAAVVLSTGLCLLGPLPAMGPTLATDAWLLEVFSTPAMWIVAALALGYPRDRARAQFNAQAATLATVQQELDVITRAYPQLEAQQRLLEERVAAQSRTFQALYQASRAIERPGVGEVLLGVKELVHAAIGPRKFSLFLVKGSGLKSLLQEGWQKGDGFATTFERTHPLYQAVIRHRRFVCVTHPGDEVLLQGQGMLAGPVIEAQGGAVVGMLKIEGIDFLDLHPTNVRNFQLVCLWIGQALSRARALEALVRDSQERVAEEVAA
jgi:polysaccharide biosynthesis protein PelD